MRERFVLQIGDQVVQAMAQAQGDASRRRIAGYLREVAPQQTAHLTDDVLLSRVRICEGEALALGLESEADIGRWAFLQTMANGVLFAQDLVRAEFDMATSGRVPSETLDLLFDEIAVRFRRSG